MYSSNIILTHTLYILVATNNINLFARIYHVTRRTPTNRKAPLHRFRYQWPSTNASHAGSPKSCRVIQTVVEKEILGNDASRQSWHRFCVNGWTLMTNFNMHGIYLMCISSICLCVVVFLQVTDIWAMVTWYLSCKWYFHTVPNTAKGANGDRDIRTSNQSHTKYYVRVYHYIFFFVNIGPSSKAMLSPWLPTPQPFLINPPCCCIHGAQQRCLLIDTLSEVCYEGARNVETPPNNKSHPFTFMILRSYLRQGHFESGCFHWFSSYFETIIWCICHAFGWLWWPNTCHNVNLSNFTSCDGKDLDQHDWPLPS